MNKVVDKQKQLQKEYLEDQKMVKGIFNFYEVRGGRMGFVYKKHKEEDVRKYELVDGQVYTIPLGVAKHLNKNGWYPVHSFLMDESGNNSVKVGEKVRRFGFQGLDFGVSADFGANNIVTAQIVR